MARKTGPSCRECRREGEKLFLKGDRCYTNKCGISRRTYKPGQHGAQNKKLSEYGVQLREKQKARKFYGVLEKQFLKYFYMSTKKEGITGENLLQFLERRLDNVVYRLGFARSRSEARQLVTHKHFTVNGKSVNKPSFLVKVGDIIAIKEKSRSSDMLSEILNSTNGKVVSKWLEVNFENFIGKVVALPSREDIDILLKEYLIVELYSK